MTSDSESPPLKRQRTETGPVTRSEIWYDDGNVILQSENTLFRVHWSILSQNSSFFRSLQGLPQPPEQPSIEGFPVIELPDTLPDVETLLRALYYPTFLSKKRLQLSVLAALIRLGRKYDFRDLLELAVERLIYENPPTLDGYMALSNPRYNMTCIESYTGVYFDIITLARENNILSVLPCAYYRAVLFSDQVFDGIEKKDGTSTSLAPIDQRRCVLGRESVLKQRFRPGYTLAWLRTWDDHDDNCTAPSKCIKSRDELFRKYTVDDGRLLALATFQLKGFCASCKGHANEAIVAGRKKVWEDLPGFFGLPPWDELKNDL
ncbi:hypothetical protein B0H17DRAFT_940412 [Mycena rosella]|uniref:BTB domain-containing protein n=1 Tax=Mycena rosella TaxID=1033263 RepID=A0AAD7D9W5_MYCRO|nr:hypothetical protein B0H17DRAFT_940412 [Mycena rosella]